jgi:hypothetical protein
MNVADVSFVTARRTLSRTNPQQESVTVSDYLQGYMAIQFEAAGLHKVKFCHLSLGNVHASATIPTALGRAIN